MDAWCSQMKMKLEAQMASAMPPVLAQAGRLPCFLTYYDVVQDDEVDKGCSNKNLTDDILFAL